MIHKLADGPVTIEVESITLTEGKFGPQFRFVGTDGTEVYINEASGQRGLDRLKLDVMDAIGQRLTLFQVKKDGKTFTNIERAGSAAARAAEVQEAAEYGPQPAKAATASVPAVTHRKSLEELGELYGKCLDIAFNTLVRKCEEYQVPIDGSAVQAATATLFIAAK